MNSARKTPDPEATRQSRADQESTIREREERQRSERPRQKSDPSFSLDQRMDLKISAAKELLSKLEPQDARARLLHIAVLRRDESLLDGILAELASPPSQPRRPR